eukprot:7992550-Pyramimonas_sp.AAC.2
MTYPCPTDVFLLVSLSVALAQGGEHRVYMLASLLSFERDSRQPLFGISSRGLARESSRIFRYHGKRFFVRWKYRRLFNTARTMSSSASPGLPCDIPSQDTHAPEGHRQYHILRCSEVQAKRHRLSGEIEKPVTPNRLTGSTDCVVMRTGTSYFVKLVTVEVSTGLLRSYLKPMRFF